MSNELTIHHADVHVGHDTHHEHHHHETFITKYVFSQDHKMIAKTVFNNWNYLGYYRRIVFSIVPFTTRLSGIYLPLA